MAGVEAETGYAAVQEAAVYVKARTTYRPQLAVVCGSGLSDLIDMLEQPDIIMYTNIPHFPHCSAPGHEGRLVFGMLRGRCCVCMQGRFHMYEGFPQQQLCLPIRVLRALGVRTLILTSASGGINTRFSPNDVMVVKDHISFPNLAGLGVLMGKNDSRIGPRFPALSELYDAGLRKLALDAASHLGFSFVREGTYGMQAGPCYETPAEVKLMQLLGIDAAGMSVVPEAVAGLHCDMHVLALSLVTCMAVQDADSSEAIHSEQVLECGRRRVKDIQQLITRIVETMQPSK